MALNDSIRKIKLVPRGYFIFGIFLLLFIGLMITVEINNGKFWTNDFRVYYDATRDFFNGSDPYSKSYGLSSGFFKYPPTTLYFFSVLSCLPYFIAQLLHVFVLAISFYFSLILIHRTFFNEAIDPHFKKRYWLLYLGFLFSVVHLVREFHMGNVNLLLLGLFSIGLIELKKGNQLVVAILWSLMVILKPIMVVVFVSLIFFKYWKLLLYLSAIGILYFCLPILHIGWSGNLSLWYNWFGAVAHHGDYIISENSLTYLAEYYFGIKSVWWPSLVIFLILVLTMFLENYKSPFKIGKLVQWSVTFLAFIPNFFVTDTEHFLLSLPLLLFLLFKISKKRNIWYLCLFILLIIPFSFNANDLLGDSFSDIIDEGGFLGISNLAFIFFYILVSFNKPSELANKNL